MTSKAEIERTQAYDGRLESRTGMDEGLISRIRRAAETLAGSASLMSVAELVLLLGWSLWVGRLYIDFDPKVWPIGGDYPLTIQPHYIWTYLRDCGSCIFWNGLINGGYPAFAESVAAILHPLVIVPTLIWGVINGSKVTLLLSFFLAGVAQWWLGKTLRLGRLPRMWAAAMAVVGGHLAGRMEMGLVAMVFSTASASLVLAPAMRLGETGKRRDAVVLAAVIGLALLSGQLYIQVVLALTLIVMALVFSLDRRLKLKPVWREYRLAGVLGMMMAGAFLVPFLHFLPNFTKFTDAAFAAGQPLSFVPLNLVINDFELYRTELLGKLGFPAMYMNYIGWLPILLSLVLLRTAGRKDLRKGLALLLPIVMIFGMSSSTVLAPIGKLAPILIGSVRFPSLMSGLAVPLVLGLAAWGLDQLLKLDWPKFTLEIGPEAQVRARLVAPVLAVLCFFGLKSVYDFNAGLLKTTVEPLESPQMSELLSTETTQWVAPPIEHPWIPPLLEQGIKVTSIYRPFNLKDRESPPARIGFFRGAGDDSMPGFIGNIGPFGFVEKPEVEYASVQVQEGSTPCLAEAKLGHIEVDCDSAQPGTLTVYENAWSGWKAYLDGESVDLVDSQWLSVDSPAGKHRFEFRYVPWDVPIGIGVAILGILLAFRAYLYSPPRRSESRAPSKPLAPGNV